MSGGHLHVPTKPFVGPVTDRVHAGARHRRRGRAAGPSHPGGTLEIRAGSPTGTLLGTLAVPITGSGDTFQTVSTTLTGSAAGPLYLVFTGTGTGTGFLFDVDTFTLIR